MSLGKTWYRPEKAAAKYGLETGLLLEWVEEGLVRCEREEGKVAWVNIDDVELQAESLIRSE